MLNDILAPLLTTEWGRRTSWGIIIVASCLIIYTFFSTLFMWYGDLTNNQNPKITNEFAVDDVSKLINQIPQWHLFGAMNQDAFIPVTSLQLRLVGVIKAVPEKFSRVIISERNQPAKVYQIGESLSSGVTIHEVVQDGVILENSGRLEKLPLQRTPLQFQGMPKSLLPSSQER